MTLSEYLDWKNLTETEFGSLIGRSQSAVNKLKNSKRRPDWETLTRIVAVTDGAVTWQDFVSSKDPPAQSQDRGAA
jgi:hypothetical protein